MTDNEIQMIAFKLHHLTSVDEAASLLEGLDARALRRVGAAYDPRRPIALRPKAGRVELVRRLIASTVSLRLWVAAWKAEQL